MFQNKEAATKAKQDAASAACMPVNSHLLRGEISLCVMVSLGVGEVSYDCPSLAVNVEETTPNQVV